MPDSGRPRRPRSLECDLESVPQAGWGASGIPEDLRAVVALGRPSISCWWRSWWSGAYVALAVTVFVLRLSRNLQYAAATAPIFSFLAWRFRARGDKAEPIMLKATLMTTVTPVVIH